MIYSERHCAKYIELHNQLIEIDLNMISVIEKLNKTKLITRGCCEDIGDEKNNAYIIFEYNSYVELLNNLKISGFFKKYCSLSSIYYANNDLRSIEYNEFEYNNKFKNVTEIWICIRFPNCLLNKLENIIDNM